MGVHVHMKVHAHVCMNLSVQMCKCLITHAHIRHRVKDDRCECFHAWLCVNANVCECRVGVEVGDSRVHDGKMLNRHGSGMTAL